MVSSFFPPQHFKNLMRNILVTNRPKSVANKVNALQMRLAISKSAFRKFGKTDAKFISHIPVHKEGYR